MSLKGKLARYKNELVSEEKTEFETHEVENNPEAKWKALGAEPFVFDDGCAWVRTVSYPLDSKHGLHPFSALKEVVASWNRTEFDHPLSSAGLSFDELLFFDTETTGLGHGVGNTIFLIGCGRVLRDRVEVKQFFLPSPNDEVALYQAFLSDVKELKNLVTYNGKAFDWPQVKTRHTFLRDAVPKLPAFGHFDLLHASRRLWKDTLESNRLAVVERDILNFERTGDTPGHLVPIYYFEYVKRQDPDIIRGVLEHNEADILSLITLYTHLSRLLLSKESGTAKEQFEIGRWHTYIGNKDEALTLFSKVEGEQVLFAKTHMAAIYKQRKYFDQAMVLWKELSETSAAGHSDILIEMAKAYEHHYRDYENALICAKRAHQMEKQTKRWVKGYEMQPDTLKRIERLERKRLFSKRSH